MKKIFALVLLGLLAVSPVLSAANQIETVDHLWEGFDPRALPLDVKVLNESTEKGITVRTVQYTVEMAGGTPARMVAYYGFPVGAKKLPAVLHVHGGGQNAVRAYVTYWAAKGYAAMSIDWGGKPLENKAENGQTDWGSLHVNQNDADSFSVYRTQPDTRVNSWYHWAIGIRRSITFLEQQPEVEPTRIGVYGISMGGRLMWLVAGTETRARCITSIYGAALMDGQVAGIPGSEQVPQARENPVWHTALDAVAYAPRIKCPFLFLSPTNDFFARMDFAAQVLDQVPAANCWRSFTPHYNHTIGIDHAPTLVQWMAYWLKGEGVWPKSPGIEAQPDKAQNAIAVAVSPDRAADVQKVTLHYGTDQFSEGRFWRTLDAAGDGTRWNGSLPLTIVDKPVLVFANVLYKGGETLSTKVSTITPTQLQTVGITPKDPATLVIDDFRAGARDWYVLGAAPNLLLVDHRNFNDVAGPNGQPAISRDAEAGARWIMSTHKIGDPKWQAPAGAALQVQLRSDKPNDLVVAITRNDGRKPLPAPIYTAIAHLKGGDWETATFPLAEFKSLDDGSALGKWDETNLLVLAGQYVTKAKGNPKPTHEVGQPWQGPPPAITRVEWVPKS